MLKPDFNWVEEGVEGDKGSRCGELETFAGTGRKVGAVAILDRSERILYFPLT